MPQTQSVISARAVKGAARNIHSVTFAPWTSQSVSGSPFSSVLCVTLDLKTRTMMPDHREHLVAFLCVVVAVVAYSLYQQHAENVSLRETVDKLFEKVQQQKQTMAAIETKLSDVTSMWKKNLDDVKDNKLPAMDTKLSDVTSSWKKSLDDVRDNLRDLTSTTGALKGQMDQLSSVRRSTDDLSHQATKLTLNMDTLKERHSDLKRALNDVDARVKDTEGKMRKLVAEDEELRKKIVNFQGEIDNLRRLSDRNPLYDIFSRFLGYFTGWSRRLLE